MRGLKEGDLILISWMPNTFNKKTKYLEWTQFKYKNQMLNSVIYTWSEYILIHKQFVSKLPRDIDKYNSSIIGCAGIAGYETDFKMKKINSIVIGMVGLGLAKCSKKP